jgi:hypothetical protein
MGFPRWRVGGPLLLSVALWVLVSVHIAPARADDLPCGTKKLYGKTLAIHVVGDQLPCSEVRKIIRGRCRTGKTWSCFSFQSPAPLLVWFKEAERFQDNESTVIEARRYPCRQARVTARSWGAAQRSFVHSRVFPSRLQMLSDDLIRCHQLRGKTSAQVRRLLGRPDEGGARYPIWWIGLERDSFFQVDSEYLQLVFRRDGIFRSISIEQG